MTMRKHYIPCCVLGLALTSLVGCGGVADRPQVYPVSGTVMYKGEPLEGANVSFHNDEAPRAAAGVTDAEGKFQLSMFGANDGSLAGQHVVTVTKYEAGAAASDGPSEEEMMNDPNALAQAAGGGAAAGGPKSLIPEKYGDKKTSPLKNTVEADGDNEFVLKLTD